ncbi:hypothetical protein IWQ55_003562 [Labrenzia sp. EL_208]|nr:hypothetical protein [Labrenzia sp. EL_132]MBG6230343.1 hypothetical protein [Labrenzia sp. EL_208]
MNFGAGCQLMICMAGIRIGSSVPAVRRRCRVIQSFLYWQEFRSRSDTGRLFSNRKKGVVAAIRLAFVNEDEFLQLVIHEFAQAHEAVSIAIKKGNLVREGQFLSR